MQDSELPMRLLDDGLLPMWVCSAANERPSHAMRSCHRRLRFFSATVGASAGDFSAADVHGRIVLRPQRLRASNASWLVREETLRALFFWIAAAALVTRTGFQADGIGVAATFGRVFIIAPWDGAYVEVGYQNESDAPTGFYIGAGRRPFIAFIHRGEVFFSRRS